ncbi:MAG TPA: class I SAM-dependent methyltransferase [Rhodopila sp.]
MANADLLSLVPPDARRIVEIGCMLGAMAREVRNRSPQTEFVGIDIDPDYAAIAKQHCTQVFSCNIETIEPRLWQTLFPSDCWIFGDCLEHLHDPWRVLRNLRDAIDPDGCLLVCIPNAQHWSVQWRLASGQFRYEESGLMDRTHIRWFTRTTLLEMFQLTGWQIETGLSRNLPAVPQQAGMLQALRGLAVACGFDPDEAVRDALPFQYVFKCVPDGQDAPAVRGHTRPPDHRIEASARLYQIAYSAATLAEVEENYLTLDNLANERADWREYWPIRNFLLSEQLDDDAFYAFFSPKFAAKTQLTHAQVTAFVQMHASQADVVLFSPQPDMGAFFLNVFEQAEVFDPGLIDAYETFLTQIGRSLHLRQLLMDSRQVVFSNYFAARPAFWREWLNINEPLFAICEGPETALQQALCRPTSYDGIQRKVFLQERAASLLLATQPRWRSVAYNPFGMGWSMSRFREHPTDAVISDALKMAYRERPYPEYLEAFANIRERFRNGSS